MTAGEALFCLIIVFVIALIYYMIQQQKRMSRLELNVSELTVLILTNPHTDQKLVEHFNTERIKKADYTANSARPRPIR